MTPQDVITGLLSPEELLRHCMLSIAGGGGAMPPNGPAAIATFKVTMGDIATQGFTTGKSGSLGLQKKRAFAYVNKLAGVAKPVPAADEVNAYYVPMAQTSDIANGASHYTLPTAGGPDIMITSRLSGCRFGVGSDATGAVLVSHVQPNLQINQAMRQGDLSTNLAGGFALSGGPMTASFSMGNDYAQGEKAAVIGKRTGGVWHFYLQNQGYDADKDANVIRGLSII